MDVAQSYLRAVPPQDLKGLAGDVECSVHDLHLCLLQLESSDDDSIGNAGPKAPASSRTAHATGLNGQAVAHPSAGAVNRFATLPAAACAAHASRGQNKLAHAAIHHSGYQQRCLNLSMSYPV